MRELGAAAERGAGRVGAVALLAAALALGVVAWVYDGRRADGAAGAWRPLSDAGLERTEVGAARIGNSIFVVGGFLAPSAPTTAAVERYDVRRDRWSRGKPMPIAVNHPAVVSHRGFLYVFGGYTDSSFEPVTGALQRFDPRTRRWRPAPPMETPREHVAAAMTGDGLYVFGGRSGAGEHDTVERFDPRSRRWSALPSMRTARHGLGGAALGRRIYALEGGPSPGFAFSDDVEFLDLPRGRLR